jgi:sugar/nucleoside kinase (ribokinase family)
MVLIAFGMTAQGTMMKKRAYDVLVAGEINPDLILTHPDLEPKFGQQEVLVDSFELTIGSSSAIFACGLARLGGRVLFVGVVGEDLFGNFMIEALHQRGIDTSSVIVEPNERTGISIILTRGADRAILTYPGAIAKLTAEKVSDDLLQRSRHLHVASYFLQEALQPDLKKLFQRAHAYGLTTSLDINWDPGGQWEGVWEALSETDLFFLNSAEALALTGESTVKAALTSLADAVPVVAVKLGSEGGMVRQGEELLVVPAISVPVVDTVGAGDSFDAGFVYGYLQDWPLERCLKLGVACGSLSLRAAGGTNRQPDLEEAMYYVEM